MKAWLGTDRLSDLRRCGSFNDTLTNVLPKENKAHRCYNRAFHCLKRAEMSDSYHESAKEQYTAAKILTNRHLQVSNVL
jgi:hypothetical protein